MLKRATVATALLTAPVFVLGGCNSSRTSTTPSTAAPPTTWAQANPSAMNVVLKTSDGRPVANASIDFWLFTDEGVEVVGASLPG